MLLDAGFWISAIRPPTVPVGQACLRITLSTCHEFSQIDALLDQMVLGLEQLNQEDNDDV